MPTPLKLHRPPAFGLALAGCAVLPALLGSCTGITPPPPPPPPELSVGGLSEGETARGSIRVTATATGSAVTAVEFRLNGEGAYRDASAPFEYARSGLPNGPHTLQVRAYADASEVAQKTLAFRSALPAIGAAGWISSKDRPTVVAPLDGGLAETGSVAAGGKVYVVGGLGVENNRLQRTNRAYAYDPQTNRWASIAPYPGQAIDHPSLVNVGDTTLYLIGGLTAYPFGAVSTVWAYDIAGNTWAPRAPMPDARGAGVARLIGDTIYYAGGIKDAKASASLFAYRVNENRWETLAPMKQARDHLTGEVVGGKLHVIGGRYGHSQAKDGHDENRLFDNHEVFDPATGGWEDATPLPTPRGALASGVIADATGPKIIAFGGERNGAIYGDTFAYDPVAKKWLPLEAAPMPTARHGMHGATLDNRLYVPGGAPDFGTPKPPSGSLVECYCGPKWAATLPEQDLQMRVHEVFGF